MEQQNFEWNQQAYRISFSQQKSWKSFLRQNGFVVIKDFISQDACQGYIEQFWNVIEQLSQGKVDRNNTDTQILGKNYPPVLHGGMIQYIGHLKIQWQLRRMAKPIFQQLWDTKQLKSSFDGFCFMNGRRRYKPRQDNAFLHVDQSPTKNYLWSYQGICCLTQAGDSQGGFVCVPRSHNYHHKYFQKKKILNLKDNWFVVPEQDKKNLPLNKVLKVNNKAGDFILFDSRTFHCNTVPISQNLRVCSYVCMIPTDKVPEQVQEKRQKAVKERRTSNHHPGDGFKIFPKVPRYVDNPKQFQALLKKINFEYKLNKEDLHLI